MSKTNTTTIDPAVQAKPLSNQFIILVLLATASAIGLSFGLHSLLVGHEHTFGTTREVPWGILIGSYVFFACLSTGLCIVSSLGQIFGVKSLKPIVGRTVLLAIITIATGLMSIFLELENPWRVPIYSLLSPHPESNIWWKSTIYSTYLLFMILNFVSLLQGNEKRAKRFAIVAFVAVTLANLNMKADMSLIGARGFWAEHYMPIYFLTLSSLAGCSGVMFFTWLASKLGKSPMDQSTREAMSTLGKLASGLLLISLFFTAWKAYAGLSGTHTANPEAMDLLVRGAYSVNFWFGEVILAVAVPLLLIAVTRARNVDALATAAVSTMVGIFIMFYDLVVVGQLVPHFHKYNIVDLPRYYSYTPSLHENMIFMGAVFFALACYMAGEIFLRGVYNKMASQSMEANKHPNL